MKFYETKPESYLVEENMNKVFEIVHGEMDKNLFSKKYNLSGQVSDNGGLDLFPKIVFAYFQPNFGPMAKVNLSAVNISSNGNRCKLDFKRMNGLTYKLQVGFTIGLSILVVLTAGLYASSDFQEFDFNILLFPLFGLFYFLLVEGFTDIVTTNTKKRVLKILTDKKVKYKKQ